MRFLAAKPAALPRLSQSSLQTGTPGLKTRNGSSDVPSFRGLIAALLELLLGQTSAAKAQMKTFVPYGGQRSVSRPLLGHCFGTKPAPCGTALFCFGCAALSGSRFLPEQVCEPRQRTPHKLLPGPAKKALLGTWEPGPLARLRHV
jgi:hypothetical protein